MQQNMHCNADWTGRFPPKQMRMHLRIGFLGMKSLSGVVGVEPLQKTPSGVVGAAPLQKNTPSGAFFPLQMAKKPSSAGKNAQFQELCFLFIADALK